MTTTIQYKQKRLKDLRKKLKTEYRGIDKQIDMLVDNISGWYLGTNTSDKPTIINLWSITGLGKTSMIRSIMEFLGKSESLIEIPFSNETTKSSNYRNTVYSFITKSRITQYNTSDLCIFLDEFQNMKTIRSDGSSVEDLKFQDLWTMLSDGRLMTKEKYIDLLDDIAGSVDRLWCSVHSGLGYIIDLSESKIDCIKNKGLEKELSLWKKRHALWKQTYNDTLGFQDDPIIANDSRSGGIVLKKPVKYNVDYTTQDIFDFSICVSNATNDNLVYTANKANFDTIKGKLIEQLNNAMILGVDMSTFETIFDGVYKKINDIVSNGLDSILRAKNLLVIIAGNQDSLFEGSSSPYYTYKDIDYIYEKNKNLKWYDLKQKLLTSLKPEQVSRLGMLHIIYPTLDEKAYKQIIDDRTKSIIKYCKSNFKSEVVFSPEYYNIIYRNSVFPTQGVRPVLSMIDGFISNFVGSVVGSNKKGKYEVTIDENSEQVIITCGNKKFYKPIILEVSAREKDCGGKSRLRNAVHEAGHAIIHMFIKGTETRVDMAPLAPFAEAWTDTDLPKKVEEEIGFMHTYYISEITTLLGGRASEKFVFGEYNLTGGCYSDLTSATQCALLLLRRCGMRSKNIHGIWATSSDHSFLEAANLITTSDSLLQEDASDLLKKCDEDASNILLLCKPILIEMTEYLMNNVYMSKKDSEKFLKKINKIRKSCGVSKLSTFNSKKLWEKFKNENSLNRGA